MFDHSDGGYRSRKMVMSYVVMGLMTLGFAGTALWPALQAAYAEYCMSLMGASGIYIGGNTFVKWMSARKAKMKTASPTKEEAAK